MFRILLVGLWLLAQGSAMAAISVVDDDGRSVALAQPARRIVALAPHLTELVFAAGAGERLVGVSDWSDFPAAAKALPRVGDSAMLDLERIVALRPDLVLVWRDGSSAQQWQRLAASGLTVYAAQSTSLAHIAHTLRQFGTLAGTQPAAERRALAFEQQLRDLRARYAGRAPLKVFYQIWHQPLMTVNGRHVLTEALQVCGASNPFAALPALVPTVTAEAVLAADPDAIVTGRADPDAADQLDLWRQLKSSRAGRLNHLVVVDPDTLHRSTDRMAAGIADLCRQLDRFRP
jgi:iron complex transport system substrate-binding protein